MPVGPVFARRWLQPGYLFGHEPDAQAPRPPPPRLLAALLPQPGPPFHVNLAVGAGSWALYHFTESPVRRKGRMTERQKLRRAELERLWGRADPRAVERGMMALLDPLLPASASPALKPRARAHRTRKPRAAA
ncbi:MAG: hypothetical protein GF330_09875 [Candidatus Eisenbacteria bacterium]|nr:hypothetical protein [Candidatus Eisenbacteria bacterium]